MKQMSVFVVLLAVSVLIPQAFGDNPPPPSHTCTNPNQVVNIPDPVLEGKIRGASGSVTCGDMKALTELDANTRESDDDIQSLKGLQHAVNLTRLVLAHNQISDLSPLAGLTNLRELYLWGNQISDLSPLAGLTNLEGLGLYGNQISDLTPLAGLMNLKVLALSVNQVSDLTPLAGLTNLTLLVLEDNKISDLTPLAGLTKLTELVLDNNQISDISALVSNSGIDNGDKVVVDGNCLELSGGSEDLQDINTLLDRGVDLDYKPQKACLP